MNARKLADIVIRCAFVLLCCLTVGIRPTVAAADLAKEVTFDIPAQQLPSALLKFATQSGVQITSPGQLIEGKNSAGVMGTFDGREALRRILQDTQLQFDVVDENTVMIVPIATQPPKAEAAASSARPQASNQSTRTTDGDQKKSFWDRFRMAQVDQGTSADSASTGESSSSAELDEDVKLEEITVTAQKRGEQNLSDVPISITVLEGDALEHGSYEGVADAVNQVAGVNLFKDNQGGGAKIAVRGVSSGGALFFGASTVGYYLDDAPFGFVKTAIVPDANVYDLQQVEVLRGPQGTLYGASALNGVVRVLTKEADLNAFDLKARTSISTTRDGEESYRGDAAINVPLIPGKLAARAVASYNKLGGWIDNTFEEDANDGELSAFRLKINAQPTEALNVKLSAWHARNDYGAPSTADESGLSDSIFEQPLESSYDVYSLTASYDFSTFSLTSATSYIDFNSDGELDFLRFFPLPFRQPLVTRLGARTFTQEVRLHSTSKGIWQWSFGGIYRDSEDHLVQLINPPILPAPIDFSDLSESHALFGELSRRFLSDKLELTLGVRYFQDDVRNHENIRHTGVIGEPLYDEDDSFDTTTPRVVLTWYPNDDLTLYTSYSRGFRSGFPQNANVAAVAPLIPSVKPDRLKNYELGFKGNLIDGRLFFDAASYYIDWQDVQQTIGVVTPGGPPVTAVVNGKSASGMGVDLGLTSKPLDNLHLRLSMGWNDLALDSPITTAASPAPGAPTEDVLLFEKGDRLNESPEITAGLSGNYFFPLGGNGLEVRLSASVNYHSPLDSRSVNGIDPVFGLGDDIVDTRMDISIRSPMKWTATLFADNLTDEDGVTQSGPFGFLLLSTERPRPRTIGVQLEYTFGRQ